MRIIRDKPPLGERLLRNRIFTWSWSIIPHIIQSQRGGKSTNIMVSGKHNFKQMIKPKNEHQEWTPRNWHVSFDNTATECTKHHLCLFLPKNVSPESSHEEINLDYRQFFSNKPKFSKNISVIKKQEVQGSYSRLQQTKNTIIVWSFFTPGSRNFER